MIKTYTSKKVQLCWAFLLFGIITDKLFDLIVQTVIFGITSFHFRLLIHSVTTNPVEIEFMLIWCGQAVAILGIRLWGVTARKAG